MNGVDLGYTSHCCQSSERDRMGGAGIVEWLRTQTFPIGSVGQFLQASLSLPFSKETYLALRKLRLADFQNTYLRLIIGKRKRICWVYNLWKGIPKASIAAFLTLPPDLKCPADVVAPLISKRVKLRELLGMIEAGHIGYFSPLLISIMGGRFDGAQPLLILLEDKEIHAMPLEPKLTRHFSQSKVAGYVRRLKQARRVHDQGARSVALDEIRAEMREAIPAVDKREAAAIRAVDRIYKKLLPLQSVERESRAVVSALMMLEKAAAEVRVGSPEDLALSMIEDLVVPGSDEDEDFPGQPAMVPRRRRRTPERPRNLYHPQTVLRHYGLGDPPPAEITDIRESVCRIAWAVLAHSGRRAHCLSRVVFSDFVCALDPMTGQWVIDVIIRGTKSRKESMMRIPLSLLWPEAELVHLLKLLERIREVYPGDWESISLMELISGEKVEKGDVDERSSHLRRKLPRRRSWLHLPRANFVSWLVLRILCARDRRLLEHSWFQRLRDCEWFSDAMLDKLSKLMGNEATDALEVARRLTGHASSFELIHSYCSSWAIQGEILQAR
jgi:hypothetical protein